MNYHNAAKRISMTPEGSDPRSADRVSLLCQALSLSPKGLSIVAIHGESGKSACAAMLSRALFSRGYRVGTLTTPFSHTMTECVTVDCLPISMGDFAECVSRVLEATNTIRTALSHLADETEEASDEGSSYEKALRAYLSHTDTFDPFSDELLLVAALLHFSNSGCRIAFIEIPCGQRSGAYRLPLPAKINVITATHSQTEARRICRLLDKRAKETVTALQEKEVYDLIADTCVKMNCRLSMPLRGAFYPADFAANRIRFFYKNVSHTLQSGAYYQALNLLTVSETLEALSRQGIAIDPLSVDFQAPQGNAGVELQFSFLSLHPTIITDFANTPSRMDSFAASLSFQSGFLGKKITVFTERETENSLSDETVASFFSGRDILVDAIVRSSAETVRKDLKPIVKALTPDDSLLILGSRPFVYEATRALYGLLP